MNNSDRPSSGLWEGLLAEQRQSLVRTLGEMSLRRVRQAPPVIAEASDDERGAWIEAARHAA
jgi:hypothetical protein